MKMHYKKVLGVCCTLGMVLFLTNFTLAQVGNTCDTPFEITALPFDHAGNMADYGNDYAGADRPDIAPGAVTNGTGSNLYLSGDDVVYAYTPAENGVINISTTNSDDWVSLWAFTGCPFGSTVGYHTQTSGETRAIEGLSVLAGTTYYFVVSNWPTVADLDYTIHVEVDVPDCPDLGLNIGAPCDDGDSNTYHDVVDENCECTGIPGATNDEACTATALECGDDIAQSLIGATASVTEDACFGTGTADVWFSFVSDGSQSYTVSENTSFDAVVQLFMGEDCGNLTEVGACSDTPEEYKVSEAGTYYFRVRPYFASGDEGNIGVDLVCTPFECPALNADIGDACDDGDPNTVNDTVDENCDCVGIPVVANNEACTATVLECGDNITQSLVGASSSMTDDCGGSGTADVWFSFVSDGSQSYTVSENTFFDAIVQLFMGDNCGNLTEVGACADSPETFSVSDPGTYYFRVRPWSSFSNEGTIGVDLECTPFDCPALKANIGDACDDGDPNTLNDIVTTSCVCMGQLPGECLNSSRYPAAVVESSLELTTIATCAWRQEYTEIGGVMAGEEYEFTGTLDAWITVRTGAVDGPAVGTGYSPLTITAPNSDNLFVHWNVDDECGTSTGCIVTTVQCLTCPIVYDCPDLEANIGDACDDGNADTINDAIDENCDCTGIPLADNDEACTATVLACGDDIQQSLIGASSSMSDDCFGTGSADVWFTFVSDGSEIYTVSENTTFDAIVQLFVGDNCENLTEAGACSDFVENYTITEAGTYYFRVRPYSSSSDEGIIGVALECVPYDCPDLLANFGDVCDDGDPDTYGDTVDENCDCVGVPPQACENTTQYPAAVQMASADIITITCQFLSEYSEVGGIMAGDQYQFTVSGNGWITVRTGSVDGPVVGFGESTLTVTAPNSDNLFVHWNEGPDCSTSSGCRITTIQCTSCPIVYDCPELELNIGDACDDGNPNSLNDTVNEDCECVGVVPPPNNTCSSAVALSCDQSISHHTHGATPSEGLSNACGGFSSSDARDVWFGFQADGTSDYTLTLSADTSAFDGVMFVYSGSCGSLVEVACSDDSIGSGDETITLTAPDAGIYYVRVYDYFGTGEYTMGLTCVDNTPPCEDPFPAVDGLNAQIQGAGIMFSWNPAPNQIGCQFRINPINGGTVTRTIGGANASSQFVPAQYLAYGTTYTWAVRCGCSQNPIVAGPWVSSTFTTPGGAAIMSSPNPTSDVSNVTFSVIEEGFTTLEVYDMNGRSIETLYRANAQPDGDYRFEFNGSDLPAGVYIYRLTTDTEVVIEKFMITK